jgi:hypothetical protein
MLRALEREADKVDDDIRLDCGDAHPERAGRLLVNPVDLEALHTRPRVVRHIRLPRAATGDYHFMPGFDEARDQKGADVASRADYDDAHRTKYARQKRSDDIKDN